MIAKPAFPVIDRLCLCSVRNLSDSRQAPWSLACGSLRWPTDKYQIPRFRDLPNESSWAEAKRKRWRDEVCGLRSRPVLYWFVIEICHWLLTGLLRSPQTSLCSTSLRSVAQMLVWVFGLNDWYGTKTKREDL